MKLENPIRRPVRLGLVIAFGVFVAFATRSDGASAATLYDNCYKNEGTKCLTQWGGIDGHKCKDTSSSFQCATCCADPDPKMTCDGPGSPLTDGWKNCEASGN